MPEPVQQDFVCLLIGRWPGHERDQTAVHLGTMNGTLAEVRVQCAAKMFGGSLKWPAGMTFVEARVIEASAYKPEPQPKPEAPAGAGAVEVTADAPVAEAVKAAGEVAEALDGVAEVAAEVGGRHGAGRRHGEGHRDDEETQ